MFALFLLEELQLHHHYIYTWSNIYSFEIHWQERSMLKCQLGGADRYELQFQLVPYSNLPSH